MSHFVVVVVGDDVDGQLAPFNEQPDEDSPYIQFIEHEEIQEEYESYGEGYDSLDEYASDNGYVQQDGRWGYMRNPNAKWDWYQLGGRWNGYFKLKDGFTGKIGNPSWAVEPSPEGFADQATVGAVDLESMRNDCAEEAAADYDNFFSVVDSLDDVPRWEDVREKHGDDVDAARSEYNSHPKIMALREADLMPWFREIHDVYGCTREEYIERARNRAGVPYAFVKDGKWFAKGDMGWFGISSNEIDENEWCKKYQEMLDSLPEDTVISAIDCHI